jgi:cytochrome bd-type quinol oxidase subunit 2
MQNALLLAYLWLVHVLVTSPVVAPVLWFGRHRVRWNWWEATVFIVPFSLWLGLVLTNWRPKTLANLGECFLISLAIVVGVLLRTLLGRSGDNRRVGAVLVLGVTAIAVATYFVTPMWPE